MSQKHTFSQKRKAPRQKKTPAVPRKRDKTPEEKREDIYGSRHNLSKRGKTESSSSAAVHHYFEGGGASLRRRRGGDTLSAMKHRATSTVTPSYDEREKRGCSDFPRKNGEEAVQPALPAFSREKYSKKKRVSARGGGKPASSEVSLPRRSITTQRRREREKPTDLREKGGSSLMLNGEDSSFASM